MGLARPGPPLRGRAVHADADGSIDEQELDQMLDRASRSAFELADADRDGRLTQQEAAAAVTSLARRVTGADAMANDGGSPGCLRAHAVSRRLAG